LFFFFFLLLSKLYNCLLCFFFFNSNPHSFYKICFLNLVLQLQFFICFFSFQFLFF
jgi:hypothetical protein